MISWFDFQNYLRSFVVKNPTQTTSASLNTISWLSILVATYAIYQHYIDWNFDDSYIVFRIVENIISGAGWAYNPGEAYNASTSVLNTVLIAVAAKMANLTVPNAAHLVGSLGILVAGSSLFLLLRGRLATGLALIISIFIMFSMAGNLTWGLETHLFCGGVLLFCYLEGRNRNTWWLVGVLILLRPDAILILLLKIVFDLSFRKISFSGVLICFLILMPWIIFSTIKFGQVFPDTLSNKVWQGKSGFWGTGPIYLKGFLIYFWQNKIFLALSPLIIFGFFKTIKHYTPLLFLFIFVGAQQAAYMILNVPTYHWYLTLPKLSLILLALIGLAELVIYSQRRFAILNQLEEKEFNLAHGLVLISALIAILNLTSPKEAPDGRDVSYAKLSDAINSANIPAGSLAALEVGTIGYKVKRPILDLVSLTSKNPEFLTGRNNDLFFKLLPQIVVVHHPVWHMEKAIYEDPRFDSLYSLGAVISDTAIPTKYYVLKEMTGAERENIVANSRKTAPNPSASDVSEISVSLTIRCNVDSFAYQPVNYEKVITLTQEQSTINIEGWVFDAESNSPLNKVFIVLHNIDKNITHTISARAYERPDVAKAFSLDTVLASGFRAEMNLSNLEKGAYQVYIADPGEEQIMTCDKFIKMSLQ